MYVVVRHSALGAFTNDVSFPISNHVTAEMEEIAKKKRKEVKNIWITRALVRGGAVAPGIFWGLVKQNIQGKNIFRCHQKNFAQGVSISNEGRLNQNAQYWFVNNIKLKTYNNYFIMIYKYIFDRVPTFE